MEHKQILALGGPNGSGKSTLAANAAKKFNACTLRVNELYWPTVGSSHVPTIDRGPDWTVPLLLEWLNKASERRVILDGIQNPHEVETLRKQIALTWWIVWAPHDTRALRVQSSGLLHDGRRKSWLHAAPDQSRLRCAFFDADYIAVNFRDEDMSTLVAEVGAQMGWDLA